MTNIQPPEPQPSVAPLTAAVSMPPAPAPPSAFRKRLPIILLIGGLLAGLCLCSTLCAAGIGTGVMRSITERSKIEMVVGNFMSAMAAKNTDQAYTIFSTRAQRQTKPADLAKLLAGNNYALFDGYQSVSVANMNFTTGFNSNPDVPQGNVVTVNGTVKYGGGFTGRFDAVLEQENGEWRLDGVNVVVPPDKIGH